MNQFISSITLSLSLLLVLSVGFMGCAPQRGLTAQLQPRSLRALNLEETLGRRDEVMLAYTLTAYDAANKAVSVVNGAWGVESIKKDQTLELAPKAQPISLPIPRHGRVVASVVLIEVDNYTKASETLSRIQKIHNIVSIPVGILVTTTEVLTPLKYVTAGLIAAGAGIQLADHFDTDDVLGQSSSEIRDTGNQRSGQRLMHVPAQFSGRHLRNAYSYELTYDIGLKRVRLKPAA